MNQESYEVFDDIGIVKDELVEWIRSWFAENGPQSKAVIGISGGKDSTIVAALCAEALGADRVVGVIMPNIYQSDIADAWAVIDHLGIKGMSIPITTAVGDTLNTMRAAGVSPSNQTIVNLPARIRMATLYAVSQSVGGRVANTCNLSEDLIGYFTRYGDGAGDFAPLALLTCTEVIQIGHLLGLPEYLVDKTPSDGLCGKTDEDSFGFTYDTLDKYIRRVSIPDQETRERIDVMMQKNEFKLMCLPAYNPEHHLL